MPTHNCHTCHSVTPCALTCENRCDTPSDTRTHLSLTEHGDAIPTTQQRLTASDATGAQRVVQEFFSVVDAAAYLGTSERFVRRLIAERRIAYYKLGRHVRIKRDDMESFVDSGKVDPMTAADVWRHLRGVA